MLQRSEKLSLRKKNWLGSDFCLSGNCFGLAIFKCSIQTSRYSSMCSLYLYSSLNISLWYHNIIYVDNRFNIQNVKFVHTIYYILDITTIMFKVRTCMIIVFFWYIIYNIWFRFIFYCCRRMTSVTHCDLNPFFLLVYSFKSYNPILWELRNIARKCLNIENKIHLEE